MWLRKNANLLIARLLLPMRSHEPLTPQSACVLLCSLAHGRDWLLRAGHSLVVPVLQTDRSGSVSSFQFACAHQRRPAEVRMCLLGLTRRQSRTHMPGAGETCDGAGTGSHRPTNYTWKWPV